MSSGRKKHAPSEAHAKRRKKRGKKSGEQFFLPVDSGLSRADAAAAGAGKDAAHAEGPPADNITRSAKLGHEAKCNRETAPSAYPARSLQARAGVRPAGTPQEPVPDGAFLSSGRAFLLAACVSLLLLVLESERAARYLDEFAHNVAAQRAASLLRTVGRASGAVRLGEWEDALILRLAGNTPFGRQTPRLSTGADSPDRRSPDSETTRAPMPESATGPAETADARAASRHVSATPGASATPDASATSDASATPYAPATSYLSATPAPDGAAGGPGTPTAQAPAQSPDSDVTPGVPPLQARAGQQAAPEVSTLPADRAAVHGPQASPEVSTLPATRAVSGPRSAGEAATLPADRSAVHRPQAPRVADIVPPSMVEAPRESAGADAAVAADPALSGATLASLPEKLRLAGTGEERKTVLLVGDSMMGWGLGHMLERGIRAYPWISVKRYSRPSTGLCRITDVDWPKFLGDLVAEHSPDLVVISIGANDGFTMTDLNRRACTVFTPAWEKEYLRRAEDFVHIAGSRGAKVLWVGLPVAGVDKTEKVLRTVSRLQQDACAKFAFASYIDIRAVLADKDGRYTSFRPGNNAEPVRIRAADKVHVSAAGGKLLTDYIMPSVLKTLGGAPQVSGGGGRGTARIKAGTRAVKAGG
ncbi:MAG: DUF459 domain-containing protein [Desulfovibrio sp.]|jgi:hypothetical protein|nr:DUF459 domain-containing protein [Desulfovibrio sp.]